MEGTKGFLQDSTGNFSSGRLISLLLVLFAIVAWFFVYIASKDYVAALATFTGISTIAVANKQIQSVTESKTPPNGA